MSICLNVAQTEPIITLLRLLARLLAAQPEAAALPKL
jgi:hypothetical protein